MFIQELSLRVTKSSIYIKKHLEMSYILSIFRKCDRFEGFNTPLSSIYIKKHLQMSYILSICKTYASAAHCCLQFTSKNTFKWVTFLSYKIYYIFTPSLSEFENVVVFFKYFCQKNLKIFLVKFKMIVKIIFIKLKIFIEQN